MCKYYISGKKPSESMHRIKITPLRNLPSDDIGDKQVSEAKILAICMQKQGLYNIEQYNINLQYFMKITEEPHT